MTTSSPIIFKNEDATQLILLQQFSADDPVYVFDIGWHKTDPNHTCGPSVRPYYLLHLVEKGKGTIERDGTTTTVGAGEAFLIRPNEITTYCSDHEDPWEYYWISFYGPFSHQLIRETGDQLFMKYAKSGLLALKHAIEYKIGDRLENLHILFQTLNSIKNDARAQARKDVVSTALHIMENNYFRLFDVTSLAVQLGFSRAYFTTLFTQKTGETPYNYLMKVRISHAKEYLRQNELSVEEIAFSVGFSSVQRFSEMFKKYVGLTPSNYRKHHVDTDGL